MSAATFAADLAAGQAAEAIAAAIAALYDGREDTAARQLLTAIEAANRALRAVRGW